MIYHNVGLSKAEAARLKRCVASLVSDNEIPSRKKYLTKSNLLRIFVLRGLESLEQGYFEEQEETSDLLVKFGRAKGRANGRR